MVISYYIMTKIVSRNWKSYFKALKEYKNLDKNLMVFVARSLRKRNPNKFKTKPKPPSLKPKDGIFILIFTINRRESQRF